MSRNRLYQVVGKDGVTPTLNTVDKVVAAKQAALKFLTEFDMFDDVDVLPHLLIASSDTHHKVLSSLHDRDHVTRARTRTRTSTGTPLGIAPAPAPALAQAATGCERNRRCLFYPLPTLSS